MYYIFFQPQNNNYLNYINLDKLKHYFSLKNMQQLNIDTSENNIYFVWFKNFAFIDNKITNMYYKKNIFCINNLLNTDCVTNKYNLFFNLKKYFPKNYLKFTQNSFELTNNTQYKEGVYIVRPVLEKITKAQPGRCKDIYVYNNYDTFKIAKNVLLKYDQILVSEYLKNPLLFNNKKFILRVYLLYGIINNKHITSVFEEANIFTAKDDFINDKYFDNTIHTTRIIYTENDYLFPNDFTNSNINNCINSNIIYNNICSICNKLAFILKKNVKLMDNTQNGFYIFGLDFILDDNFNVLLIECNRNPSFGIFKDELNMNIFHDKIIDWLYKNVFIFF